MYLRVSYFVLLLSLTLGTALKLKEICADFQEGACDITEYNTLGLDRHTASAAECQLHCINLVGCTWFTHFDTQCYLLSDCGEHVQNCEGCTSGPTTPDLSTCPWPPGPNPTTTTTQAPTTSTTTTTTTTTPNPTTTTATADPTPGCEDIILNE